MKIVIKNNNALENLQLMTISDHRSLHAKLAYRNAEGKFVATLISNDNEKTLEYAGNSLVDNQQGSLSDPSTTKCQGSCIKDEDIV